VATQWGWALGTAHARGDVDAGAGSAIDLERWMLDRLTDPDAFVASGLQIGLGYAQIVRDDHRAFVDAVGCSR
jgi:hypothetical protein